MKLKPQYETEVYVSEVGYICLKQRGYDFDTDEVLIVLSPGQAEQIADHIINSGIIQDASEVFHAEDTP